MHIKIAGIFLILLLAIGSVFYFRYTAYNPIVSYTPARDKDFIQRMFSENWYWFIPDYQEFSPQTLFSPNQQDVIQQQVIKIAVNKENKPVGFVVYYMPKFYEGKIRFIGVDQQFRGQGYSKLLLTYAVQDLFKHGAKKITLMTRLINEPARALYEKMGFRETKRHDLYIDYQVTLDTFKKN